MANIFAIVSKKIFEKECPGAKPGDLWSTRVYASEQKLLDSLSVNPTESALFLITVRTSGPEKTESLWLVAILESPAKEDGSGWTADLNVTPIRDITALRSQLKFNTGTGITAKAGALAMSLQTPRVLAPEDVALLRGVAGGATPTPPKEAPAAKEKEKPKAVVVEAPPPAIVDQVIQITDEARKYLRARSPADLGRAPSRKKINAEGLVREEEGGTLEGRFIELITKYIAPREMSSEDFANAMVSVNEDVRARYIKLAEKLWAEGTEKEHIKLLGCFPDRADWAKAIAENRLAHKQKLADLRDQLLPTLADRALLVEVVKENGCSSCVANIVLTMREEAVPVLEEMFEHIRFPNEEKAVSRALSCIATPEAAALFSKHLRKQNVRPFATEYYARFPALAKDALAELASKKTQVGEIARTILAGLERAAPDTREAAHGEGEGAGEELPHATLDELPEILREPPWTRTASPSSRSKTKKKKKPTVAVEPSAHTDVPLEPLRFHWNDRARRRYVAANFYAVGLVRDDEAAAELKRQAEKGERIYLSSNYAPEVAIPLLDQPASGNVQVLADTVPHMLAAYGERVVRAIVEHHLDKLPPSLALFVESPRVAQSLARRHLHFYANDARAATAAWLERFPETAALGLVPTLLGGNERGRTGAALGIRHLVRKGHEALVRNVPAVEGAAELSRPPKMPTFWRVNELRPPRLKNGKVLPRDALEVLDRLLCASAIDLPAVSFEEIRRVCEPRSLAEHAWDLARAWDINGAKERDRWMLHAIAHIGDDEVVRRLTPALKGEGIAPMLGVIATDAALMELVTILVRVSRSGSARNRPKYSWGVEEALDLIAARRGLDRYDLEDYFVPTCNVGQDGRVLLDLGGGRTLTVTFDPQLACILHDETGAKQKVLPRTGKDIDPEKVAAAATLLSDLQEDVTAIADLRAMSLERAMIDGRTWSLIEAALSLRASVVGGGGRKRPSSSDFAAAWVDHPLMKHMARGVLWEARAKDGRRLAFFRIAEDGSFADENDDHHDLPVETTQIGVAHPVRMTEDQRVKFRAIFSDYKILQPFEQLAREPHKVSAEKLALETAELPRPATMPGWAAGTAALKRAGWAFNRAWHALAYEDGSYGLLISDTKAVRGSVVRDGKRIPFAEADEVLRTEVFRAMELISSEVP